MLDELFELQAALNKRIGNDTQALRDNFDPLKAGVMLNDYLMAASNELEELRDCTYWKHWCKEAPEGRRFELHDLQNARVPLGFSARLAHRGDPSLPRQQQLGPDPPL